MKIDELTFSWRHLPEHRVTQCWASYEGKPAISVGTAILHPNDQYCKETGRKVSLRSALMKMKAGKEFRARVWETYRTHGGIERWKPRHEMD